MTIVTQEAYNAALLAEAIYLNSSTDSAARAQGEGRPAAIRTH